jgi:RNA polymerase sigma factor (sigma-70 family)
LNVKKNQELLTEYVRSGSEQAFRELVARYIDLVYSTGLRMVGGDRHLAEDVAQTVFTQLALKAHKLSPEVMLGGWLHRATYNVAATLMRGERRRRLREQQAAEINAMQEHTEDNLAKLVPILDEAIEELGANERAAVLLRFFEQREFGSMGEALGLSEDGARKRVGRALNKLQSILKRRGVTLSTAVLASVLGAQAVTAAPAGLATSIAATALTGVAAGGGTTLGLLKVLTMTKLKIAALGAVVAASVVTR